MPGKNGFIHSCDGHRVSINGYKKSLTESAFSYAQIDMIWDFYVTHSLGKASGQRRELTDYGWEKSGSGKYGYKKLEVALKESATINDFCFIRAKTCKRDIRFSFQESRLNQKQEQNMNRISLQRCLPVR